MVCKLFPLPSPQELKQLLPLPTKNFLDSTKQILRNILLRKDPRKVFIVGPCSIHDRTAALEYAKQFKELSSQVQESCVLVMRVYVEKSRSAHGWKGLLHDPHLDGSEDILTGLLWTRELLCTLAEQKIPCAAEFVNPLAAPFFEDLISWGFIGARTCASQPHRQYISSLNIPVGFKNSTDGNLNGALYGILSAREAQNFIHVDPNGKLCKVETSGNPYTHIVLRGSEKSINYDATSLTTALQNLNSWGLSPKLMIDCSHGNSHKNIDQQKTAFFTLIEQMHQPGSPIFGLMLESHLKQGCQPLQDPTQLQYAVSVTDPCLSWQDTEEMILSAHSTFSTSVALLS